MRWLNKRRVLKRARETLRHSQHLRNMREDLMSASTLTELLAREGRLRGTMLAADLQATEAAIDDLYGFIGSQSPKRFLPGVRENIEVAVVAISVAMAFRTYFVQPFKIPTGSMQPTLYGIQTDDRAGPAWSDRLPIKLAKWMLFGEWYKEIRAKASGTVAQDTSWASRQDPSHVYFYIGDKRHKIPKTARVSISVGDYIARGTLLWRGVTTAGDHVFVDKVRWNFRAPKRGNIVVFNTKGIERLEASLVKDRDGKPMSTHYIKRLVGLPNERISIHPPDLVVDGRAVREPASIGRIARREPGYEKGYQLVKGHSIEDYLGTFLRTPSDTIALGEREYFALGDNTTNSRDGRYWGAVPQKNLVGPGLMVYWPISKRWGLVR